MQTRSLSSIVIFIFIYANFAYAKTVNILSGKDFKNLYKIIDKQHETYDCNNSTIHINKANQGLFIIKKSHDITIKNCHVAYDYSPIVDLNITHIDKKRRIVEAKVFDLKSLKHNDFNNNKIYIYPITQSGIIKEHGTRVTWVKSIELKENDTVAFQSKNIKKNLSIGDRAVLVFRYQGNPIVRILYSKNITIENITMHDSPSAFITALGVDNLSITNNKIVKQKARLSSTVAAAVHCQSCKNITIKDNIFDGLGDDCINLYTRPLLIKQQIKDILIVKKRNFDKLINPKDIFYFFNPKTGKIILKRKLISYKSSKKNNSLKLKFKNLPNLSKDIQIYDINLAGNNFLIQGNTFKNSRRYGILLKAHNGKIINNSFKNLGGSALMLSNSLNHFLEGLNCENILIQNNKIENCGFGNFKHSQALIEIGAKKKGGNSLEPFHKNIQIIDNVMNNSQKYYLNINNNVYLK